MRSTLSVRVLVLALLAGCAAQKAAAPPPATTPPAPSAAKKSLNVGLPQGWAPLGNADGSWPRKGTDASFRHAEADASIMFFVGDAAAGTPQTAIRSFRETVAKKGGEALEEIDEDGLVGFVWQGPGKDGAPRAGLSVAWRLREDPSVIIAAVGEWPEAHMTPMLTQFMVIVESVTLQ